MDIPGDKTIMCHCSHRVRALLALTEHGCPSLLGQTEIQTAPQKRL